MSIDVVQITAADLPRYAAIPSAFTVDAQLRVEEVDGGLGGLRLVWEPVAPPWLKDYDACAAATDAPETPATWPALFDVSNWAFFLTRGNGDDVGAAAVAFDTPGIDLLERRRDLAVLWDIRVRPDGQRRGAGRALVQAAADWARHKGCRQLKIETQNVGKAAKVSVDPRRRLQLRNIAMQAGWRLTRQPVGLFIDEHVAKVRTIAARQNDVLLSAIATAPPAEGSVEPSKHTTTNVGAILLGCSLAVGALGIILVEAGQFVGVFPITAGVLGVIGGLITLLVGAIIES